MQCKGVSEFRVPLQSQTELTQSKQIPLKQDSLNETKACTAKWIAITNVSQVLIQLDVLPFLRSFGTANTFTKMIVFLFTFSEIVIDTNGPVDPPEPHSIHPLQLRNNTYRPNSQIYRTQNLIIITKMASKVTQRSRSDDKYFLGITTLLRLR